MTAAEGRLGWHRLPIFFSFSSLTANSLFFSPQPPPFQVIPAFGPDGTYAGWDAVEALWDHAFKDRLRLDASEHPMMLAEPTAQPDRDREEVVERVFEGRGPQALFLARDAVLSSFATGRATAMVVDAGHDSTTGEFFGRVGLFWGGMKRGRERFCSELATRKATTPLLSAFSRKS